MYPYQCGSSLPLSSCPDRLCLSPLLSADAVAGSAGPLGGSEVADELLPADVGGAEDGGPAPGGTAPAHIPGARQAACDQNVPPACFCVLESAP